MADEKDEEIGIIYGKHAKFFAWLLTQEGPWNDAKSVSEVDQVIPSPKTIHWPSKPDLPSMILKSSLSRQDVNYIPLETAMAREYAILEYADKMKKAALDYAERVWKAHGKRNG